MNEQSACPDDGPHLQYCVTNPFRSLERDPEFLYEAATAAACQDYIDRNPARAHGALIVDMGQPGEETPEWPQEGWVD